MEILCLFVLPANSIYLLPAVGLQCRGKGERPDCWTKLCIPGTGLNNAKETKEHKLTIIYTEFFNYDAKLSFFYYVLESYCSMFVDNFLHFLENIAPTSFVI